MVYIENKDELYHHGIKGQRWGVRRFQNPDGSLTAKGAKRYAINNGDSRRTMQKKLDRLDTQVSSVNYKRKHEIDKIRKLQIKGSKTTNLNKQQKILTKMQQHSEQAKTYQKMAQEGEKFLYKNIAKTVDSGGYNVSIKSTMKDVNKGKRFVAYALAGPIGAIPYILTMPNAGYEAGNNYKLTKRDNNIGTAKYKRTTPNLTSGRYSYGK